MPEYTVEFKVEFLGEVNVEAADEYEAEKALDQYLKDSNISIGTQPKAMGRLLVNDQDPEWEVEDVNVTSVVEL